MSEPSAQVVEIERIDVAEGFNPRSTFDEGSLAELEASIRANGVVQALTVRPNGNGGFVLVAGERRLIAARRAGLKTLPVVVREDAGALAAAISENLVRADLDPIEEAEALRRLGEAEKLATRKQIAARVGKSANHVSERLRLLKLPEGCRRQIAAGAVSVAAEPQLRKVAKVSPAVAEFACDLVARGELEGRDLVERFDEVLDAVSESARPDAPTMIDVSRGAFLSCFVADPERRAALAERFSAACPYAASKGPVIRLTEAEIDAARAAGCLIDHRADHGGWTYEHAYVCDAEFGADLAVRAIERIEKEAAEVGAERAKQDGSEDDADHASAEDRIREARRAKREKAKVEAEAARSFNLALGAKLLGRRGAKSRKSHSLARAKAVALILLADNDNLAARGLRLALPQLQEVEVKTLKSGESREKIAYADPRACGDYLAARIDEAHSADEVLELLADALIAATLADEHELPQSRRALVESGGQRGREAAGRRFQGPAASASGQGQVGDAPSGVGLNLRAGAVWASQVHLCLRAGGDPAAAHRAPGRGRVRQRGRLELTLAHFHWGANPRPSALPPGNKQSPPARLAAAPILARLRVRSGGSGSASGGAT